jgi:hypothetical protein
VLKKTITYKDFNGEEVSEDFFFHLSKAELVELEMSHKGGLSAALERIVAAEDNKSIIAEFKNIILAAYGKRSEDGKRFIKTQELRDEFISTEAYSTLFMELVTDTDAAVVFINGVIPQDMVVEAAQIAQTQELQAEPAVVTPLKPKLVNRQELMSMPQEDLTRLGEQIQAGEVELVD